MRGFMGRRAVAKAHAGLVRLVIVEHGAWDSCREFSSPEGALDTAVLLQDAAEPSDGFLARVHRRIELLERSGRGIATASVYLSSAQESSAMAGRLSLARAVLGQFAQRGVGELLFDAAAESDRDLRHALLDFVETLVGEVRGQEIPIRVRFSREQQRPDYPSSAAVRAAAEVVEHRQEFCAARA